MQQINGQLANLSPVRFIDLFCGIGGFRFALEAVARRCSTEAACVFSSDIDIDCQKAYEANFGESPHGDITTVKADAVPDHDILLAGFPCQPFSIMKLLAGHDGGKKLKKLTLI